MGLGESHQSADETSDPSNGTNESNADLLSSAAHIVAQERAVAAAFPHQRIRSGRPGRNQLASILQELLDNHAIDVASNIDDLREVLAMPRTTRNSQAAARSAEGSTSSEFDFEFDDDELRRSTRSHLPRPKAVRRVTKDFDLLKSYNYFMDDLENRNGAIYFRPDHNSPIHKGFLPQLLFYRELHFNRRRPNFSSGQRAAIVNSYLPNTRRSVAIVKSKTFCSQFMDDGATIATASQDGYIRLYHRGGEREQYLPQSQTRVPACGWSILDFVISSDNRHLIYTTWDTNLYQLTLSTIDSPFSPPEWQSLPLHENDRFTTFSLKMNTDNTEILGGGNAGHFRVFNRELNRPILKIDGHQDDVNAVAFADSSSHLILSASDDGLCKVWDRRILADSTHTPSPVGVFAGHRDGITFIDARGDDRYVLTTSKDQTIKLWDLRHFSSASAEDATKQAVARQNWDYRWQASPVHKGDPLPGDCSIMTFYGGHMIQHTLIRARFSPDHTGQRFIYTGCARGNVAVYDMYSGDVCTKFLGHKSVVRDCHWHPHLNEILSSGWDGQTAIWHYDERATRNINPDTVFEDTDNEESCDENYRPMPKIRRRGCITYKRPTPRMPRFNSFEMRKPSLSETDEPPRTTGYFLRSRLEAETEN
ncbi:hypothetical protein L596_027276 [Steinernema carpocapsae]|uniref:DDB1- and CUL4-associated factor 11 n=1 Tax=Steinernema carpocapsae TaxID=34508 RepID=A0A4U5M3T8_STECR|nr:hypothetical protein L596_027276 [Steinernema carpocapsae]